MLGSRPLFTFLFSAAVCLIPTAPGQARDYGVLGETWEIAEDDLLTVIEDRLTRMEEAGRIDELNREMAAQGRAYVNRPAPVAGIAETLEPRSWLHDPSFVVGRNITDHRGRLIAAEGTRINPLDHTLSPPPLLFIDGDVPAQVDWALNRRAGEHEGKAKIVLVAGSPPELMKKHRLRLFFDQKGLLTRKFGIKAVPAEMKREGGRLRITETKP